MKQIIILTGLFLAAFSTSMKSQSANFEVVFNEDNCLYEAHMHVVGNFPSPILGTSGFTLVVPAGTNNDDPIIVTQVNPSNAIWQDNSPAINYGETGKSYHKFATNSGQFAATPTDGSDVTLFTFALPDEGCLSGVRVLRNDNLMPPEPNADPQPIDVDFNNSLQISPIGEVYAGNVNNTGIVLPSPTPAPSSTCTPSEIQLNTNPPAAYPACLSMAYSWDGPNGFTSAVENPTRAIANEGVEESGDYNVTVTDLNGCEEVRTVNVDATSCSLVPVEFQSFDAHKKNEHSLLEWETASELNNERFEVERSADGKIFDQIGQIQGSGTTSEIKSYQFLDRSPEIGFNFYRLKQVDFNGEFEYSEIRSVKHETISHFQVFPNPTSDFLVVNAPGLKSDANASYQLINELGQVAQKGSLTSYTRLDVSDRENGIYFLQIFNDQKIILRTIKIYVLK